MTRRTDGRTEVKSRPTFRCSSLSLSALSPPRTTRLGTAAAAATVLAARISNCSPETADADRERMERERSMMVSLARGAERANIAAAAAAARGRARAREWPRGRGAFIRAMVLAPVDWRSEWRIDRRNVRRRPSFLPYRFSETILPGAPPSRAAAVAKTIRNGSRDFSFSSPPSSLFFSSFPTYLSIAERAGEGMAEVSLASLDATASGGHSSQLSP